jgi:hypothetical protein
MPHKSQLRPKIPRLFQQARMTTGAHQLAADFDQVPAANWASGPGCARLGIPILRLLF